MANMCVSSIGYNVAEGIRFGAITTVAVMKQAVAIAEFVLNAKDAVKNFKALADVNEQALEIEEAQLAQLEGTVWGAEDAILADSQVPTTWDSEAVLAKRYAGRLWPPFAAQIAKELRLLECNKSRYCSAAFKSAVQEIATQAALARANVTLMAEKIAWYERQAVDEMDFNRRLTGVAGRSGGSSGSNAMALLGHAAALVNTARQGFASNLNSSLAGMNSALAGFGNGWAEMKNARNKVGSDPAFHNAIQNSSGLRTNEDVYEDFIQRLANEPMRTGEISGNTAWGVQSTNYSGATNISGNRERFMANEANFDLINADQGGYISGGPVVPSDSISITNDGGGAGFGEL